MSFDNASPETHRLLAWANYAFLLAMMAVIALILIAAAVMQYAFGELPCPLCLLQRVAMLGICFGILLQFRNGFSYQNTGISIGFALFLLIVAERQTLLDIYPRPGHAYIGSAVFGLHMPVWSIIIALVVLIAFALKLAILGGDRRLETTTVSTFPRLAVAATAVGAIVVALAVLNFGSVIVQCGINECHTMGYQLLGYTQPAS
ncbi:disulfide bond formation protein B [Devosia sp. CN2-171]|uniref:disulfide bond formation protein B n=1 Tax=Devosia sp. CN2-171 TaxID=3400909 RepID=UPI003BF7F9A5